MTPLLTIVTIVLRLLGFAQWAVSIEERYKIVKKTQEIANAPLTDKEESDYWRGTD